MKNLILSLILISAISCTGRMPSRFDLAKAEIISTEKAFCKMAADSGIARAFIYFADDNAVIQRGNMVIEGIDNIKKYLNSQAQDDAILEWAPDFVSVSSSCDMGYTYGKYSYSVIDSTGKEISTEGIFHTVWEKQPDGSWKYVWD
jgi:ketosteroid isomerase-like protein